MNGPAETSPLAHRPPRPFLYLFLFLPYGAGTAYVSVTIAALASRGGLTDGEVAGLSALYLLPHTWKFLWAPAVDWLGTPHRWYLGANLVASAALAGTGLVPLEPGHLGALRALVFLAGASTTIVAMATESLMAHLSPLDERGRAAGWSQAGNVGGAMVGGLALILAERSRPAVAAVTVAVLLLCCALPLAGIQAPARGRAGTSVRAAFRELGDDLRGVFLSRSGALAFLLCVLPIGSGGAQALFAAIAPEWGASTELVASSNGVLAGIASVLGCLAGGRLSDAVERRRGYVLAGLAVALSAFAMAAGPRTPAAYAATVLTYSFALGLAYATFTGFALEAIGKGAAATKYNVLASLSNIPIYAMTQADGWVADHWDRTAMLWVDGAAGVAGGVALLVVAAALRRRAPVPA